MASVREFLEREIMPAVDGRLRFLTRVTANVIGQLARSTMDEVVASISASVVDKLMISNPRYLCTPKTECNSNLNWT